MKKIYLFLSLLLGLSVTFITSCEQSTEPPPTNGGTDNIKIGEVKAITTQSVGVGGGSVVVSGSGTSLEGLEITVPPNAYSDGRSFSVSYADIKETKLPQDVQVISPMIIIKNGGGYSEDAMKIKIPVTIPAGSFALGFFWNEKTGELEPLHLWEEDATSITLSTRHFAASSVTGTSHSAKSRTSVQDASSIGNILILAMDEAKLFALGAVNTNFKPGTDDWEFVNYGSYIAAGGHCAGQSMTAMWYYYEQKTQGGKLFGKYDTKANFQEDDPIGYRFASTIQRDFNFDSWIKHITFQWSYPPNTFKAFALALYVSKQPQSILMYKASGADTSGHAMIVNGIEMTDKLNGRLLIADPNKPGVQEHIGYVNGVLTTYVTGLRGDGTPIDFDRFGATGKSTYLNWSSIGGRFNEVTNKTIGNDRFPSYTLWVKDGVGYELTDGLNTDADSLVLELKNNTPGTQIGYYCYDESHAVVPVTNNAIKLSPGKNKFGFHIVGKVTRGNPPQTTWEYIDFKWITVTYESSKLRIDPATMNGTKDSDYVWRAVFDSKPSNARYEWNFGDGTAKYVVDNDTNGYHRYSASGTYTISLQVFDRSTSAKLGEATATAVIGAGFEITSVVPDKVSYAMPVTINGSGFGATQGTSTVTLAGIPVIDIVSWSDTKIEITMPEVIDGACSVKVVVGGKESNYKFLTKMYPKILSINKTHAKPGEVIEIRGEYFGYKQSNATLEYGDVVPFPIVTWNDTVITAIVDYLDGKGISYGFNGDLYLTRQGWGMTTYKFMVDEDVLHTVQGTNKWTALSFGGRQLMYKSYTTPNEQYTGFYMSLYNKDFNHTQPMVWTGTSFTFAYTESSGGASYDIQLSGTMSDDGTMIKTIHGYYRYTFTQDSKVTQEHHYEYDFKNIPLSESRPSSTDPNVDYKITGPGVKDCVVKAIWREYRDDKLEVEYRGTDWNSTTNIPEIRIIFSKK